MTGLRSGLAFLRATFWVMDKEVRETVRDPHVLLFLLFPLAAYPAILWATLQVTAADLGWREAQAWRIDATDAGIPERLRTTLLADNAPSTGGTAALDRGEIDLVVAATTENDGLRWVVDLTYTGARPRSVAALHQAVDRMRELRRTRVKERASAAGLDDAEIEPIVVTSELAGGRAVVTTWVATILVAFLVPVSLTMAGVYPAIDILVGERERGTRETTWMTAAPRGALGAGRVLATLAFMGAGAAGNVVAVSLTASTLGVQLSGDPGAVWLPPVRTLLAVPALGSLGLFATGLLMVALLPARTFKEGEWLASIVLGVLFLPLAAAVPEVIAGTDARAATPFVPMANTAVALLRALDGTADAVTLGAPVLVNGLLGLVLVGVAIRADRDEEGVVHRWLARARAIRGSAQGVEP